MAFLGCKGVEVEVLGTRPVGEFRDTPGRGRCVWGGEIWKIWMDGCEMILGPACGELND